MPAVEEVRSLHEQLRQSPAYTLSEEISRTYRQLGTAEVFSTAARLAQEYKRSPLFSIAEGVAKLAATLQAAESLNFGKTIGRLANEMAAAQQMKVSVLLSLGERVRKEFGYLQEFAASPSFLAMVEEARTSESFIERTLANTVVVRHADVTMGVDEPLATWGSVVSERVATLPRSTLSREGMFNLLVTLLLAWMASHQASQGEDREAQRDADFERRLMNRFGQIEQQVQALAPLPTQVEHLAVVIKPLNVRVAPDLSAERTDVLEPGHKVNVVAHTEKWLEVEYFDYESASIKTGWIAARYTKAITTN